MLQRVVAQTLTARNITCPIFIFVFMLYVFMSSVGIFYVQVIFCSSNCTTKQLSLEEIEFNIVQPYNMIIIAVLMSVLGLLNHCKRRKRRIHFSKIMI